MLVSPGSFREFDSYKILRRRFDAMGIWQNVVTPSQRNCFSLLW